MGKIITTNNSNNNNMKNDGDLKCKIKENFNFDNLLKIVSVAYSSVYALVICCIDIKYKLDCENFFGIPGQYFSTSVNNKFIHFVFAVIFMFVSFAYPIIADKYMNKHTDEINNKFSFSVSIIKIILGISLGILCSRYLIFILQQAYKFDNYILNIVNDFIIEHNIFVLVLLCLMGIVAVIGFSSSSKVSFISSIIVVSITLLGIFAEMQYSIFDKTAYEFVTIDNNEYVVLSHYDDRIVVVPYETKKDGSVIFYTSDYYIYDEYKGTFKYINLDHTPVIDKSQR